MTKDEREFVRRELAEKLLISWGLPYQLKEPAPTTTAMDVDKICRHAARMAVRMANALLTESENFIES